MAIKLPEHFCHLPFIYIYPEHNGSWKPCCKIDVYPDKNISFSEWWYEDKDLKELRDAMLADEAPPLLDSICAACRVPESKGIKSYRQNSLSNFPEEKLEKLIESYMKTGAIIESERLYTLKVRGFGNTCNLKCYMCFPGNSSQRVNELLKIPEENTNIFFTTNKGYKRLNEIKENRKDITAEVKQIYDTIDEIGQFINIIALSGGEPLLIAGYYELMDKLIASGDAKNITLMLNTNLTVLGYKDKKIKDYFKEFKSVIVNASIDDIYERDNWIRYPSNFETVVSNYHELKSYRNVRIAVNATWSILNISNAENILNFFEENDMLFNTNLNFVMSPIELHPKNFPHKEELIEKYSKSENPTLNSLAKILTVETNQEELKTAIKYIKDLDEVRGTKSYEIFPELYSFLK